MPTIAQIEAARRNGAKSNGPVTAEGKQRSAANSTQHGLSAQRLLVLSSESGEDFAAFLKQFEEKLKPIDEIEQNFVLQAAAARWRLRRAWTLETNLMDMEMDDTVPFMQRTYKSFDSEALQTVAFKTLANQTRALDLIGRYEVRLSREYDRAIRGLDRIRAERDLNPPVVMEPALESTELPKLPNEPKPAADAEVKLQNEPKDSRQTSAGTQPADPSHTGIIDKLLADPSVRAVIDPPDKHRAA